jgi:hypothetical protein
MAESKVRKQPQKNNAIASKRAPAQVAAMSAAGSSQETSGTPHDSIRRRAYELFEVRGKAHGLDQQDWHRAEREILNR